VGVDRYTELRIDRPSPIKGSILVGCILEKALNGKYSADDSGEYVQLINAKKISRPPAMRALLRGERLPKSRLSKNLF